MSVPVPAVGVERFVLTIPGPPVPCERARKGRHGWYTPAATTEFRERVVAAWLAGGRPSLGAAPVTLSAVFYLARPASHFGKGRNAAVVRAARAGAVPSGDVDNYANDALNGFAWEDDVQVVCLAGVSKYWARAEGPAVAGHGVACSRLELGGGVTKSAGEWCGPFLRCSSTGRDIGLYHECRCV